MHQAEPHHVEAAQRAQDARRRAEELREQYVGEYVTLLLLALTYLLTYLRERVRVADTAGCRARLPVLHLQRYVHGVCMCMACACAARHMQAWSPLGSGQLTRYLRDAPEAKQACAQPRC